MLRLCWFLREVIVKVDMAFICPCVLDSRSFSQRTVVAQPVRLVVGVVDT